MAMNKSKVKEIVSDYLNHSSLHGINSISHQDKSGISKGFWILCMLGTFLILVVNVYWVYVDYMQFNFITKTNVLFDDELEFPAVTICNSHSFDKNKFTNSSNYMREYLTYITDWKRSKGFPNFTAETWRSSISVHDILRLSFNANETFQTIFRFNKTHTNPLMEKLNEIIKPVHPDVLKTCFTYNKQWFNKVFRPLMVSVDEKLLVHIDIKQDRHAFESPTAGITVYIHPADVPVNFKTPSFKLSPGNAYDIQLSSKEYEYLSWPYNSRNNMDCLPKTELYSRVKLKYFPRYSLSACLLECLTDHIINNCGCGVEFIVLSSFNNNFCNVSQRESCVNKYIGAFGKNDDYSRIRNNCFCPQQCNQLVFEKEISSELFPSDSFLDSLKELGWDNNLQHARNNFIYLVISFRDNKIERIVHEPKIYFASDVLGILGGYMGFCLGASILTWLEIIDVVIRSLKSVVVSRCRK